MNDRSSLQVALAHVRSNWVKVMVAIVRPPSEVLAQYDRRQKLQILEENAQQQRKELIQWIDEHGLAAEVAKIGASTSLNVLFVQCTPHVAQELEHAPGVMNVTLAEDYVIAPFAN